MQTASPDEEATLLEEERRLHAKEPRFLAEITSYHDEESRYLEEE